MKRFLIPLLALASGLAALAPAAAQPYPNRPIKLLVGFAAGGITDITARTLQQRFQIQSEFAGDNSGIGRACIRIP